MTARSPRHAAIGSIATLPVFFKLGGRRVLVAGGTPPAVWKAELLAAAGAMVDIVAAEPCDEMLGLVGSRPERMTLHRRCWTETDIAGAALAVGAFEGMEGEAFRDAARRAGVPVNVIDVPPLCDFQFGTIVERSPLVIGISTDGAAPVLGQALRARIEALLPDGMDAWAGAAQRWRDTLRPLALDFAARRRFWERFAEMALDGTGRQPTDRDREACLSAARDAGSYTSRTLLVGAGPGEPDLVTLQAIKALQSADLILHHTDVAPAILVLARREAVRVPASPDEMLFNVPKPTEAAGTVVLLMNGDPDSCANWRDIVAAHPGAGHVRGLRCATCPDGCVTRQDA